MRGLVRIAVAMALAAIPAVAPASSHVWATDCNKGQYKPSTITVACGDGSIYVTRLNQKHRDFTKLEVTFTGGRPSYVHEARYPIELGCPF